MFNMPTNGYKSDYQQKGESMINRENNKIVDQYLREMYQRVVAQELSRLSYKVYQAHLIHLLLFAGDRKIKELPNSCNGYDYKAYLLSPESRRDNRDSPLSQESRRKNLLVVTNFLKWYKDEFGGKSIKREWISTFVAQNRWRSNSSYSEVNASYFKYEEILQIAQIQPSNLCEERIQAAIIFLYKSGMRKTAFLTLPIIGVNLADKTVMQTSEIGVRTKLGKEAITKMLIVPDQRIDEVINRWDTRVRNLGNLKAPWFMNISPRMYQLDPHSKVGEQRASGFNKDFRSFLHSAGIPYKNPHQLRHGYIRYAKDHSDNTVRSLEIIAAQTMQEVSTMLKYGKLTPDDARTGFEEMFKSRQKPDMEISPDKLGELIGKFLQEHFSKENNRIVKC
jgi:integrase